MPSSANPGETSTRVMPAPDSPESVGVQVLPPSRERNRPHPAMPAKRVWSRS